ncbi:hypothetical protein EV356DRAFT_293230 [Viridothelium virens]|uniref:Uncharacterized protein n=1 Tax=Viridothelium virens TaxID=1048519 RepID=A0A6A6H0N5_VIRVR|nr:hypothetical protein EV356DRAFT_293230 [Viridothelium virens]
MQLNAGFLTFLGITASSSLASAQQSIAFYQQLQNNDQSNHWVAWVDGEHAYPGMQVLDVLTKAPCDRVFSLGEVMYTFTGCTGDGTAPTAILDSGGVQIGGCSANDNSKIHCGDDLHDIIKHGKCGIVNGE